MGFDVLILGSDANAYYMARCCYEAYHKKAYLIGKKRLAFTKFSNILEITYKEDLWSDEGILDALKEFASSRENKKILLISTNETYTEFLARNKKKVPKNYLFHAPSLAVIHSFTDKEDFYRTYQNYELPLPKSLTLHLEKEELGDLPFSFPVVLKPCDVVTYNHLDFVGKNKIYKLKTREELENVIHLLKENGYQKSVMIQEFVLGDDSHLFDCVVYVNRKGKVSFLSFAQIGMQERTHSMVGNAAVLINGYSSFNVDTSKMKKTIRKFMESIPYRGFAEIDMKYDERTQEFKVLEINARQGRCSYYVSPIGCNLVRTLVEDLLYERDLPYQELNEEILLSFVPKGILRKYCENKDFKKKALSLWKKKVSPMDAPDDRNFKRFLMLRKRWWHYYKEYKNSYWK